MSIKSMDYNISDKIEDLIMKGRCGTLSKSLDREKEEN